MAFTEDLEIFFNNAHFTETVSYTVEGGSAVNIEVLWSEGDSDFQQTNVEVEGVSYRCLAKKTDVPLASEGDTIVKNSITYYVRDVAPTEDGKTIELMMEI